MGMQARRAFIRTGLTALFLAAAVMVREYVWALLALAIFALILIGVGYKPKVTKAFVRRLPGGSALIWLLDRLESILDPRDEGLEAHYQNLIALYSPKLRASLNTLRTTRNAKLIDEAHWVQFNNDGLVEHPSSGPGEIKDRLRDVVERAMRRGADHKAGRLPP